MFRTPLSITTRPDESSHKQQRLVFRCYRKDFNFSNWTCRKQHLCM